MALAADPPHENVVEVQRGDVAFIPSGKDWLIALGDHPEWGQRSHPVWGWVDGAEDWQTISHIVGQKYK